MKIHAEFIKKWFKNEINIEILIKKLTDIGFESFLDQGIVNISIPTNRHDCKNLYGIINELSKFYDLKNNKNENIYKTFKNEVKIYIKEKTFCPFYSIVHIKNINNQIEIPNEIKNHLNLNNIKSSNFIIDILNYSTLITGQPLHAYDKDKIGQKIIINKTNKNISIKSINENNILIKKNSFIINDDKNNIISIPGVIGSAYAKIDKNTKNIIIESAYFKDNLIKQAEKKLKITTLASDFFKNTINEKNIIDSLNYAVNLIKFFQSCEISEIIKKKYIKYLPKKRHITVKKNYLSKFTKLDANNINLESIFKNSNINFKENKYSWKFEIPQNRKDLTIKENIISEIIKFYGYNKIIEIPTRNYNTLISKTYYKTKSNENKIINYLTSNGFYEIITYSFVEKNVEKLIAPENNLIDLINPISENNNVLRNNLLQGLIKTFKLNSNKYNEEIKLFEIGNIYNKYKKKIITEKHIALILAEPDDIHENLNNSTFYILKNIIENIYKKLYNIPYLTFNNTNSQYLDKNISAEISIKKKKIGEIGLLDKKLIDIFSLKQYMYFATLKLNLKNSRNIYSKELSKYPKIKRDISIITDKNIKFFNIKEYIKTLNIKNLKDITFINTYDIDKRKSISIRLTYQSKIKTLTDKTINSKTFFIIDSIKNQFNADFKI